jgi:hypothetical protein
LAAAAGAVAVAAAAELDPGVAPDDGADVGFGDDGVWLVEPQA